jgi:hypothetical protein
MAPQVDCEDSVAFGQSLLGEPLEPASIALHAVDADDWGRVGVAPLANVEPHY